MNGRVAKALRRATYGDRSIRNTEYGFINHIKKMFIKDELKEVLFKQKVSKGDRKKYQDSKKIYYFIKSHGEESAR